MKVRALTSFSSTLGSYALGQEFELPDGVDWVEAGLVEVQTILVPEPEQVVVAPEPEPEQVVEAEPELVMETEQPVRKPRVRNTGAA